MPSDSTTTATFEHLTDDDRAVLRARLEQQLADFRSVTDAPVAEQARARDVTTALRRLHAGHYNECVSCGGDMDRRWMLAHPAVRFCQHCQDDQATTS